MNEDTNRDQLRKLRLEIFKWWTAGNGPDHYMDPKDIKDIKSNPHTGLINAFLVDEETYLDKKDNKSEEQNKLYVKLYKEYLDLRHKDELTEEEYQQMMRLKFLLNSSFGLVEN